MSPLRKTTPARLCPRRPLAHARPDETVWLFDLDNTLHDCSKGIFRAIDRAMGQAVMTALNLDAGPADTLRKRYWQRYGATVIGMVRHHGVNPKQFLEHSHNFDIPALVHAETGLKRSLERLQGRKILLTNAPLRYAETVLKTLKIAHLFDGIWAIDHMHLQGSMKPKPSLSLMQQVRAQLGVSARQVVLVEDTLRNLKTARRAGMRTVHIFHPGTPFSAGHKGRNSYVDLRINSIRQLAQAQFSLRTPGKPDHA